MQVFRTDNFDKVTNIPVGKLPQGNWPSGDGSRVYVGLENDDRMIAIDTSTNKVVATVPIGQAPQAITYVSDAVPEGAGTQGLEPLSVAGEAAHFNMSPPGKRVADGARAPTSVTLFDQGLVQVLEASVTGLEPKHPYVLALSNNPDGTGKLESLASFITNPAGAAIVNAIGLIRQIVQGEDKMQRRYLVIALGTAEQPGTPVQVQAK